MTWSIHALSQNPLVEAKLLDEINSISGEVTIEKVNQCTYLAAGTLSLSSPSPSPFPSLSFLHSLSSPPLTQLPVVNECLRMFPPAPAMFRQAVHEMQLSETVSFFVFFLKLFFLKNKDNYR